VTTEGASTPCTTSEPSAVGAGSMKSLWPAPLRDDFPNNFVGDLVKTDRGWVVVRPTCCPVGHDYDERGWSANAVWCTCNPRHMAWRCGCGAVLYAPQAGPHNRRK
jgi:hypothetical protein